MGENRRVSNPFPGLRPFETDEYLLFFGREGQSDALVARLERARFLAIVGTSGSGKSSLVRAGLLPALRGGMMSGAGAGWRVAIMRPGHDPVGNLAQALAGEGSRANDDSGLQRAEVEAIVEATLRRGSLGLVEAAYAARLGEREKLLVVVDQFEELFRFRTARAGAAATDDDAAAFVKLLLEAARQRELPIYVVLTMRSDFLGDCAQFQGLPEAINDGQYLIPRMTRDERRVAIVGPARVARGKMTEPLVNRLLNDVGDNPDQLPILQHALLRTWDYWLKHRRDSEPVGLEHYLAVGTMSEALSLHADEAYNELPDDRSRRVAEMLFKSLTERGADNREVRRPTPLREVCEVAGAGPAEVAAVVEVFRREGRSFLMPPAGVALTPETVIDISHESLIRNWVRLRDWVKDEAEGARIYRRLADAAAAYRAGEGGLLDDVTLGWVNRWRDRYQPNRAWGVRYHAGYDEAIDYLEESRAKRAAETEERQRQQQADIARERREREQAERHAAEQARAARRLRARLWAMGGLLVLAVVAVGFALYMEQRAEAAQKRAEVAQQSVEAARRKLQKSRTALTLIQSYQMEQAENELNEFYKLTGTDDEGHANRAWVLYNLGDLNRRLERYDQAAAFFQSALHTEILIHKRLGLDSVGTLDSLAHTLEEQRKYPAAVAEFEQLSDLLGSVTGQRGKYFSLNTANVYSDLAQLYIKQAEQADAIRRAGDEISRRAAVAPLSAAGVERMFGEARAKARVQYARALNIWEVALKGEPEALANKYAEAAAFYQEKLQDPATTARLRQKASDLFQSIGTPTTRELIGPRNPGDDPDISSNLPAEGPGFNVFNGDTERAYGRAETIDFVEDVAAAWIARHPDLKLVVGDISRQGGGPFLPHLDHQDGREVDIWPLTNNGVPEPTNIYAPNYSRELTAELIDLIRRTSPNAIIYFDDPTLVAAGVTKSTLDHNTYMHVLLP